MLRAYYDKPYENRFERIKREKLEADILQTTLLSNFVIMQKLEGNMSAKTFYELFFVVVLIKT